VAVVTVRRRSWLAVGLFVLRCAGADAQSGAPTEAQVKAVFLYNFTKYVAWPTEAFRSAADPLNVCILGADAFGPVLDETLQGERVQDRKLVSRRIATVDEVDGCHLLFLSASEERQLPRILKALEAKPVLTVGETDDFAENGGMINLRKLGNKIRLEINEEAAARAGLKISSQLLKLARIVSSRAG